MPIENQTHFANECCAAIRFTNSEDPLLYVDILDYVPIEIVISIIKPEKAAAFVNGTPGCYLTFMADTNSTLSKKVFEHHKKLNLHVSRGEKIRFYLEPSISKLEAINQLQQAPILISKSSSDILSVYAPPHFRVVRASRDQQQITHNPFSLPKYIVNMSSIECSDDISPKEIDSIQKSIKLKIELLERFYRMTFSPMMKDIIEEKRYEQEINYQEMTQLKHKVEQRLLFSNSYEKNLLSLLKNHVSDSTFLRLHKQAVNLANSAPFDAYPLSSAESIYEKMKSLRSHQQVSNLLSLESLQTPPIHKCSVCDSEPAIEKKNKSAKKYIIFCTNCNKTLDESAASKQKHISIVNWNSANPMQTNVVAISPFQLSNEPQECLSEIEKYLVLAKRRLSIIADDTNKKRSVHAKEQLFKVSILFQWALYIRENI